MDIWQRIITYGHMIRFSHSVFALPFAFSGVALASLEHPVTPRAVLWICVAMVGARSAAMGFNRIVDRRIDSLNPRTRERELPTRKISLRAATLFVAASAALFIFAASQLNELTFILAPGALAYVLLYSYTKRFTWATHFFLGGALGMAPVGGWIAITGHFSSSALVLGLAVATWVAGFDIIYSCQDYHFDVAHGVHSICRSFGMRRALEVSKALHGCTVGLLLSLYFVSQLGPVYLAGLAIVGALLAYEQSMVKPHDLSKVNKAFFDLNGLVSIVYFLCTLKAVL